MLKSLMPILEIQEFDMKMIRLMRLKKERNAELISIGTLRYDLKKQLEEKQTEISELNQTITLQENKIEEVKEKIKTLEAKQSSVKKVDEFNALTQEMTQSEREKTATEQITSDLIDKRALEEEFLQKIKDSLILSEESSQTLEGEIKSSILMINQEGQELKKKRDLLAQTAEKDVLSIYERLLRNKRDRVIVPIENRTCSGCHIVLTAQHENIVRKGTRIIFCEHCSRIHFWQESESVEDSAVGTKKRRRRIANA